MDAVVRLAREHVSAKYQILHSDCSTNSGGLAKSVKVECGCKNRYFVILLLLSCQTIVPCIVCGMIRRYNPVHMDDPTNLAEVSGARAHHRVQMACHVALKLEYVIRFNARIQAVIRFNLISYLSINLHHNCSPSPSNSPCTNGRRSASAAGKVWYSGKHS